MGSPFDAYHYYVVASANGYESEPSNEVWTFGSPAQLAVADEEILPDEFALSGNYPNPFNPSTTIHFALPEASNVNIVIVDVLGREVARPVYGRLEGGLHQVRVDASHWSSGTYLYRLEATGESGEPFIRTRRMTLLK